MRPRPPSWPSGRLVGAEALGAHETLDVLKRTTMASSTTMPIESVIAKSVSVLTAKSQRPAIVPMSDTGAASIGMSVARQFCRKTKTTRSTRMPASNSVW